MADKSFGVKELNLISASGTPTITSPNSVNINATNVAISTDITVGGMVSLGAGTSISSPGSNILTFGTNSTEKLRITSAGQLLHTRSDDTTRYDLEFRQTGGISDGNYSGIHWTQGSTGTTNLAAIEIEYANNGRPDIVFKTRLSSGGTAMSESARIATGGLVGIGTDNPTKVLHLAQNSDIAIRMDSNNANANARAWEIVVGGNGSNNAEMVFRTRQDDGTGGSECARIKRNGVIALPSGGGIDFSATSDATGMSSEVLDDYEEGSWTPDLRFANAASGMTYSRQEGHYTKIGRQVFAQFRITLTSKGTSTGSLTIRGLPFTAADTFTSSGIDGQVHIGHDNGFNAGQVSNGPVSGYVEGGTDYFFMTRRDSNAALDTMNHSYVDNDLSISGTAIYYA